MISNLNEIIKNDPYQVYVFFHEPLHEISVLNSNADSEGSNKLPQSYKSLY